MWLVGEIVDGGAILDVLWASLVAGIGVTLVFSIAILGATRAVDAGRDRRLAEALLFGALGVAALVAVLAGVVVGVIVMTQK